MRNKSFIFRFDDIEVREREFTLIKAGKVLTVEPKAFRALLFLLHNPQKLIPKEELLDSVWGDVAVTEHSLTRCIWLLRQLLEDDVNEPRYIATVARVGYRFVCPVEVSEDTHGGDGNEPADISTEAASGTPPAKVPDERSRRFRRRWLVAAAVLAVGIVSIIWNLSRPLPPPHVTRYTKITHDGRDKWPVGTDGSRLYLYQHSLYTIGQVGISGGEIVPISVLASADVLEGENPGYLSDVSPDGSSFLIQKGEGGAAVASLWNVRILGGSVRRLGDGWDPVFTPDGKSVTYTTGKGDISIVRSDGTETRTLASVGGAPWAFAWAPDGSVLRFSRDGKLWEISSRGTGLRPLLAGWHVRLCCGRWTPDGKFFLFLSGGPAPEENQIWALDERRGLFRQPPAEPVPLTTGPLSWSSPIPGKDGKSIFSTGITYRGELVRFDVKARELKPFLGGISAFQVSFSKDGQSVAYVSFPELVLWKANRDGSNPMQLSDRSMVVFMPRWSPDGTQILFSDVSAWSKSEMYIVSALGGIPQKVLPEGSGVQSDPDWSPDGHKIVFGSSFGGGNPKSVIRIFDLDTRQITILPGSVGMTDPRWSSDGRSIEANSFDFSTMNIFDIETQRWSVRLQKFAMFFPEWSSDGQFIYFMHSGDARGVYRIRLKGGEPEKIVDLKNWPISGGWVNGWLGLDSTDAPLLLRDIGSSDIYALTLEEK
jgi:eukaryotic-like serine/threonine-protein kinase